MKQCSKCGKWFLPEEINKKGICKICVRDYDWERRRHITPDEYARLFNLQGGRCAICGKSYKDESQMLAVDHDHKTGKIRGLLCRKCNFAIGLLQENPVFLLKALLYLKGEHMDELSEVIRKCFELQTDVINEIKAQIGELSEKVKKNTEEIEFIRKTY